MVRTVASIRLRHGSEFRKKSPAARHRPQAPVVDVELLSRKTRIRTELKVVWLLSSQCVPVAPLVGLSGIDGFLYGVAVGLLANCESRDNQRTASKSSNATRTVCKLTVMKPWAHALPFGSLTHLVCRMQRIQSLSQVWDLHRATRPHGTAAAVPVQDNAFLLWKRMREK